MLISRFKEIENLRRKVIRNRRPAKCEAILIDGSLIVARLPRGRWWCSWKGIDHHALGPANYRACVGQLLNALAKLGIVPTRIVNAHLRDCRRAKAEQDLKWDREEVMKLSRKYGFRPPAMKPVIGETDE